MNNEDSTYVLYVDHQGHPAPLSLCYHATASRKLTSSVDRPPFPSSITEVDSAYCPQCLSFHDANTASNLGFCPKATCRLCPLCRSVSSITVKESICFYQCGRCDWNSKICDIQTSLVTSNTENGNVSLEEVEKASIELLSQYKSRLEERNRSTDDHFNSMQKTLTEIAKEHVKGRRSNSSGRFFSKAPVTKRNENDDLKVWSVQALEESQRTREENFISSINNPVGGISLERISLEARGEDEEEEDEQPLFHPSFQGLSTEIILSQRNGGNLPGSMETLLPHPIPLRPRKSRRCRAEIAESRPGILVKPKLNPLEGDSSLRTGHGQWWKKVCVMLLLQTDT
ncbi:MAG: dynactin-4 [Bacillariaceae sp.]|jgi:dynactin-4